MRTSFLNRALSLALACVFLMSAGWISFLLFFEGVGVYADSGMTVELVKITRNGSDVTRLSGSMNNLTLEFSVKNADTKTGWEIKFPANGGFSTTNHGAISKESTVNNKWNFTFTVAGCTYNGTANTAYFTMRTSGETFQVNLAPWRSIGGADFSLQSYIFWDAGDRQLQRLKKNTMIERLVFTIKDNGLTKEDYDNANKSEFSASINYATFTKTNKEEPYFSPTATALPDGSISYTLTFYDLRYTGKTDQLELKIGYPPSFGLTRRQFSEPLIEGEIYVPPTSSGDESSSSAVEIAPPTPNLIIASYNYGGGSPTAASNVMLDVSFTNTSRQLPVENIVMKVTMPEAFTLTNSSNTFYIEKMESGATEQRSIGFTIKPNAEAISHSIKLAFSFETIIKDERKQLTSEQEISIPVSQLNRMSLNPVEVPMEIYMEEGSAYNMEASFVNKGKATVYNVSLTIESDNLAQPGQLQFIGNLESGKEGTADFSLVAAAPGPLAGEVVLTYEDANMNITELRTPFSTQAVQPMQPPMPDVVPDTSDVDAASKAWYSGIPVWQWAVAGVVLIIVLAFAVKTVRTLKEKKLEAEDEDF